MKGFRCIVQTSQEEMNKLLSIIIPSYNEEGNIENTANTVLKIMDENQINCEVIFVSDGSRDNTFLKILNKSKQDNRIKGIEFSRNFGKESAILAGIEKGNGDCFVVMDCDLQQPPEVIVKMYHMWEKGYDIIEGIKTNRGTESKIHKALAHLFYGIISKLTGYDMKNTSDYKLFDKKIANIIINMPERKTFFRALTFWVGFHTTQISYEVAERNIGSSKWSFATLVKYAITNIISFSSLPLSIVTYLGIFSLFGTIALGIQTLVHYFTGNAIEGFTTVILLMLLLGSSILIGLGIIGRYISAIYDEIKGRPRYIIWHDTDSI